MKRVSFDFDKTLSRSDVQSYAKDLIRRGVEVWIVTSRFEFPQRYSWWEDKMDPKKAHADLEAVAAELGIPKSRIIFTNMEPKSQFFAGNSRLKFTFHLDDDYTELNMINRSKATRGISSLSGTYRKKCNDLLGI